MQQISQFTGFSLLFLTTATTISIIFSCKFVFRQIMSSPSFHISFHSWLKMNSTNWPAPNLWVFIAQLVDHCSANNNCNNHTIFTDFSLVIMYRLMTATARLFQLYITSGFIVCLRQKRRTQIFPFSLNGIILSFVSFFLKFSSSFFATPLK